ncbi:DUF1127 domain-containing protein [Parasedimentitalea maritima]|uniref:DUF1127 domain-containing protein n=2 Tax=Parasedimentitalea maritima TaxID=2578117 RepID=A0ABY2UTP6_9RHOB|nr:DUF1127 domain-containing protein [Zongyanglinia marina]
MDEPMEYAIPSQSATMNLSGRFQAILANVRAARVRKAAFNRAYAELQSLTEDELIEFGMHRSDLAEIARQQVEAD